MVPLVCSRRVISHLCLCVCCGVLWCVLQNVIPLAVVLIPFWLCNLVSCCVAAVIAVDKRGEDGVLACCFWCLFVGPLLAFEIMLCLFFDASTPLDFVKLFAPLYILQ